MKLSRQSVILEVIRAHRVHSQEHLRELLLERGFDVAQATLSRDIRDLGLVKMPDDSGSMSYTIPRGTSEPVPVLERLIPALYTGADGVNNLLLVRTVAGGAQPLGAAIDGERWPEVVGTIAGDDTILVILRASEHLETVRRRIESFGETATQA